LELSLRIHFAYIFNVSFNVKLGRSPTYGLSFCMFQVLWPDDDPSLGSKRVVIQMKLFTSEVVVIMNIYRYYFSEILYFMYSTDRSEQWKRSLGKKQLSSCLCRANCLLKRNPAHSTV